MKYAFVAAFLAASFHSMAAPVDSLKEKPLRYVFSVNSSMSFCSSCMQEASLVAMPTTIHGIRYKNVRLGAGIGYTSFGQIRMMPYFGSLTFNLFGPKKKNGFFIQCDYGSTHAWVAPVFHENEYLKRVSGRNFFQISTGYAYHYYKLRLAAQIGFQSLRTSKLYEYTATPYNYAFPGYTAPPPATTTQDYEIRRFFLNISFGL